MASGLLTLILGLEPPWACLSLPGTSPGPTLSLEVLASGCNAGATLGEVGSDSGGVTTQQWDLWGGMGVSSVLNRGYLFFHTSVPISTDCTLSRTNIQYSCMW